MSRRKWRRVLIHLPCSQSTISRQQFPHCRQCPSTRGCCRVTRQSSLRHQERAVQTVSMAASGPDRADPARVFPCGKGLGFLGQRPEPQPETARPPGHRGRSVIAMRVRRVPRRRTLQRVFLPDGNGYRPRNAWSAQAGYWRRAPVPTHQGRPREPRPRQ